MTIMIIIIILIIIIIIIMRIIFSEICIKNTIHENILEISSTKWRPFCLGLNILIRYLAH